MNLDTFIQTYVLNPYFLLFAFWALAWVLMLITGNPLISWLKGLKGMKWSPREDTPDSHLQKAGTPSMGGIGIIGTALVAFVAVIVFLISSSRVTSSITGLNSVGEVALLVVFPLVVALHCVLGLVDDWSKARGKGGLLARQKLLGQVILAGLLIVGLTLGATHFAASKSPTVVAPVSATTINYPVLAQSPVLVAIVLALIVIGTSNAVNITDGIDGLASGLSVQVAIVFSLMAFESPEIWPGVLYPSAFMLWMCLGGACLGFLAFNKYPAKVFMGDTGSLALGAALGAGAILTRSVFLLPFIGFMFFIEMFSVMAQVAYFKYTKKKYGEGRRIFRRAPLHHHFELGGWSEWRVVGTFWAINALTTILGLILWKVGILPRFP